MPVLEHQPASAAAGGKPLRIVVFGLPGAGKTSLLGALALLARDEVGLLTGRVAGLSPGLEQLARGLREGHLPQTEDETVPYALTLAPPAGANTDGEPAPTEAVLLDSDGRAAGEMLQGGPVAAGEPVALKNSLLGADAVVLAVDASSPAPRLDAVFGEFGRLLHRLEEGRGRRAEVGGLPVFLVLTKCDLLAAAGEGPAAWLEHVEERKRQVAERFRAFLRQPGRPPFGRIDLHVWATAVRRPTAGAGPQPAAEPFGVAELFRQGFDAAGDFRRRTERAGRRLFWTVAGTAAVLGLLTALAATAAVGPDRTRLGELERRIDAYRSDEGDTPAERLSEPLDGKITRLSEIEQDPEFASLPADRKDYVHGRLVELRRYRDYKDRLLQVRLGEADLESQMAAVEALLQGELALPAEYAGEWEDTDAGRLRAKLLADVAAVRRAVADTRDWFARRTARGEEWRTFARGKPADPSSWEDWLKKVQEFLNGTLPHPGSKEIDGTGVRYAAVYRTTGVMLARADWEILRQGLGRLREVLAALGLAGRLPEGERQPLDIPADFSAGQAADYRARLDRLYPGLRDEAADVRWPDALADDMRRVVGTRLDRVVAAGRRVVLGHLRQGGPEAATTVAGWRGLFPWLADPRELAEWRLLATTLAELQDPAALDPVTDLERFLQRDRFLLELPALTLRVPDDLRVRPADALVVHHARPGEADTPLRFTFRDEETRHDPRQRTYLLHPEGAARIEYRPGDTLWAEMPVQKEADASDWLLNWTRSRSPVYAFERLVRSPRLRRREQTDAEGTVAEGVVLEIVPPGQIPPVPALVPPVEPEKP